MKLSRGLRIVLVTAPNMKVARNLARMALTSRLIACANLVPQIESHYWWQSKLERSTEILLILKTSRKRLAALEKCILAHHPYDTPEFLVLPLTKGAERYLGWLARSTR